MPNSQARNNKGQFVRKDQKARLAADVAPSVVATGEPLVRHDAFFSSRMQSLGSHIAYFNPDEAVRNSRTNAEAMLRDLSISKPLYERLDAVALLKWHIECEDTDDPAQKAMAEEVTRIIKRTPDLLKMKRALLMGVFHGRSAVDLSFEEDTYRGQRFTYVNHWEPIHGDKLVFSADGTIGFRVGYQNKELEDFRDQIEPTLEGRVLWLTEDQRRWYVFFKHMVEDGVFEDVRRAGAINGVGIRDKIYWHWVQKCQVMQWALNHWERYGTGFQIWSYQEGKDDERDAVEAAAVAHSQGRVVLLPRPRETTEQGPGVEHIEVPGTGMQNMLNVLENYFDQKLTTFIVGQTLSADTASTGLGSGVADLHAATKNDIVRADSLNLAETLTKQLVQPLTDYNRAYNPEWPDCELCLSFELDDTNVAEILNAAKTLHDMGIEVDKDQLLEIAGLRAPKQVDEQTPIDQRLGSLLSEMAANPTQSNLTPEQAKRFAHAAKLLWKGYP